MTTIQPWQKPYDKLMRGLRERHVGEIIPPSQSQTSAISDKAYQICGNRRLDVSASARKQSVTPVAPSPHVACAQFPRCETAW